MFLKIFGKQRISKNVYNFFQIIEKFQAYQLIKKIENSEKRSDKFSKTSKS